MGFQLGTETDERKRDLGGEQQAKVGNIKKNIKKINKETGNKKGGSKLRDG